MVWRVKQITVLFIRFDKFTQKKSYCPLSWLLCFDFDFLFYWEETISIKWNCAIIITMNILVLIKYLTKHLRDRPILSQEIVTNEVGELLRLF